MNGVEDLKLLAEGRVAIVYAWEPDQVLKLAREWVPHDWLANEARIARIVMEAGIPSPAILDEVQVAGRPGIIYERVEGKTMIEALSPINFLSFARLSGQLHAEIHQIKPPDGLPNTHQALRSAVEKLINSEKLKAAALARLDALPEGDSLLHNDFHLGNIMLAESGPLTIDWVTATRGHPLADVARTILLIRIGALPAHPVVRLLVKGMRAIFEQAYLRAYFRASPLKKQDVWPWMLPMVVARLDEDIQAERKMLLAWAESLAGK
jgi:aminoglycoside phosphotransferase (APT) family kinase protein